MFCASATVDPPDLNSLSMRFLLLVALIVATLFPACKDDGPEIRLRMPIRPIDFTFDAGLSTFDSHFYTLQDIPTNFDSLAARAGLSAATVGAIRPRTAELLGVFNNVDYEFIREISVRLCSAEERDQLAAGEAIECRREIFWRNPVPEGVGSNLGLVPNENDLQEILTASVATYQVKLVSPLRYPTAQFVESRLFMEFNVE